MSQPTRTKLSLHSGTLRKVVCEQSLLSRHKQHTDLQAARWLLNIASALEHMHSQRPPIMHRSACMPPLVGKRLSCVS